MNPRGWGVRLYALLLGLLPPDQAGYRREMVQTFQEMWADRSALSGRLAFLGLALGRLSAVLVMEWLEYLGAREAPGRRTSNWAGRMVEFPRELGHALRSLRKAPAFTLASVGLIALGVGAVTTIFSLVDHVILRALPYPEADRLVYLQNGSHSGPLFQRLEEVESVETWEAAWSQTARLTGSGEPRLVSRSEVTTGFLELFGARSIRGRLLQPDDAPGSVVVLSGDAWRTRWGADPELVGRTLRIDGSPATVVGILDPEFEFPGSMVDGDTEFWTLPDWTTDQYRDTNYNILEIVGRRTATAEAATVQVGVDRIVADLSASDDNFLDRDGRPLELPVVTLAEATVEEVRAGLSLLLGAVGLLLLVACANVAHLFLARGLGRSREMAVRRAMGAGTGALTRYLLAESLVVGLAGGLLGSMLAAGGLRLFALWSPTELPRAGGVSVDLRVLAFALVVSVLTAVVFGLLPALRNLGGELGMQLRSGGRSATADRGSHRLRSGLVAGEVALSLVLIASAGLLLQSFMSVRGQELGFDTRDVWTVPLRPTALETPEEYRRVMDGVARAVRAVPGVTHVAYGLTMPLEYTGGSSCCWRTQVTLDGTTLPDRVAVHPVSLEYFDLLGMEFTAGRAWTESEAEAEPVAIVVVESLAAELFGSAGSAVGRTVELRSMTARIVGVTPPNRHYGPETPQPLTIYLPVEHLSFAIPRAHLAVRVTPGATTGLPRALREAIWSAEAELPVPEVRTLDSWMADSTAQRRFLSALFGAFAVLGLLLAAGGLYGTLLYIAGERRKEMGIRLALGATRTGIQFRLIRSGLGLTLIGVLVGILGAWYTSRLMESWVYGVEPGDSLTLATASGILLVTAALASWLPARKASRTDPVETLRWE